MGRESGWLYTCDRCGNFRFVLSDENLDFDDYKTIYIHLEPGKSPYNLVCPDCYEQYNKMVHRFMNNTMEDI